VPVNTDSDRLSAEPDFSDRPNTVDASEPSDRPHPRTMRWLGTTALGMGGANQSLFLISALVASQGTAAIPLLAIGLLLSWAALPGWTELVLMWPNRVGGIAATCAEAFRPYSPVLANLTGTCYWWGWVPTCGLTALLSASALHQWYLPNIPVKLLAAVIVVVFLVLNLTGMAKVTRVALYIACGSAALAFASGVIPVLSGSVDWHQAASFHLVTPFGGIFGGITSAMAGLYLIGFAAPAFEAAACHVGETIDPNKNVPRAMYASAGMATLYFLVLPVVWLGVLGPQSLTGDLANVLGPTFAPLLGSAAKGAAVWFMVLNMFHGTLTPLSGASRTLSQLSEDGLLPRVLARRSRTDAPWVACLVTAVMATAFLIGGDPVWVIAAANFTYLIGISLPSIAVWLLRRNAPHMHRPYRAPRFTIGLGVAAGGAWLVATVLGFEQFGLPTVLAGLALAYSGSVAYAWRRWRDNQGRPRRVKRSLHLKLTGAMLAVLALDGAGYLIAVSNLRPGDPSMVSALQDIFVAVALLTITVGLVLPGMISHSATQVADAADRLATGTLADLTRAMEALADGDLDAARARVENRHVEVLSSDEVGAMANSFNTILDEAARAAVSLGRAREALRSHRNHLEKAVSDRTISEERFRSLAASAPVGVFEADAAGGCTYTNERWQELAGLDFDAALGDGWVTMIHPDDRAAVVAGWPDEPTNPKGYVRRYRVGVAAGSQRWVDVRSVALRDDAGNVTGFVGTTTDVTPMVDAEAAIAAARDEAVEGSRLKSQFLANMSHEIRTPMNGVLGMAHLLLDTDLDRDQRRYLGLLRDSGTNLLGIINDILDFSKVEAGKLELESIDFDLAASVESVVDLQASAAHGKGLTLELAIGADVAHWVTGDPGRLRQILTNLVANAIKFTDAGHINVRVVTVDGGQVHFEVTDTGIGIEQSVGQLLDPFSQADSSTTRRFGGTGLGLAICRQLVELMAGTIDYHSQPGVGSTFWFEVPLPSASTASPVSDTVLPDGQPGPARPAEPGLVRPAEPGLARPAEPVLPDALPGPPDGQPGRRTVDDSGRVLLVDDSEINQLVARALLEHLGYHVDVSSNGAEAVAAATSNRYDAILMDCLMPVMDGYEATTRIRRFEGSNRHTTIVALTATAMDGDRQKCLSAGMDDYLAKPLDPTELATVMRRWPSTNMAPSSSQPPPERFDVSSKPDDDITATVAKLQHELGPVAFNLVSDAFLRGLPDLLAELDLAVAASDDIAAIGLARKIKANAASFGAARLSELAAQLEQRVTVGDHQPTELYTLLQQEFARIQDVIGRSLTRTRTSVVSAS
jgi:PAS domain S-box-containing protein